MCVSYHSNFWCLSKYFQNITFLVSVSLINSATGKNKCSMADRSAKNLFYYQNWVLEWLNFSQHSTEMNTWWQPSWTHTEVSQYFWLHCIWPCTKWSKIPISCSNVMFLSNLPLYSQSICLSPMSSKILQHSEREPSIKIPRSSF